MTVGRRSGVLMKKILGDSLVTSTLFLLYSSKESYRLVKPLAGSGVQLLECKESVDDAWV